MRQIEFRGKIKGDGKWIYGSLINNAFFKADGSPCYYIAPFEGDDFYCFEDIKEDVDVFEVDDETVGQYIGSADKNGKKIYEGDIVKGYGTRNRKVVFIDGCYRMENIIYQIGWQSEVEVIGNIHDSPELLERK